MNFFSNFRYCVFAVHIHFLKERGFLNSISNISQYVNIKRVGKALQQCTRAEVSYSGPPGLLYSHPICIFKMLVRSRLLVLKIFQNLFTPYTIIFFSFASLKLLTTFENSYGNPPQNSFLGDWSLFSSDYLSLAAGKMRKN